MTHPCADMACRSKTAFLYSGLLFRCQSQSRQVRRIFDTMHLFLAHGLRSHQTSSNPHDQALRGLDMTAGLFFL